MASRRGIDQPRRRRRGGLKTFAFGCLASFACVCVVIVGGGFYAQNYYNQIVNDDSGNGELVNVEIPEGSTTSEIAAILSEAGLISDETIFGLYVRSQNAGPNLKAGDYEFLDTQTVPELVEDLIAGAIAQGVRVTIPEGLRYDEVANALSAGFAESSVAESSISTTVLTAVIENPDTQPFSEEVRVFLAENKPAGNNLEGFLFPDTYEFPVDVTELQMVELLLQTHIDRVGDLVPETGLSYYESLVVASIVEREAFPNPGEPEEVAGIFLRRINAGDKIGADASVLYPYKRWKPEPTFQELNEDTPYNTRLNVGIPPTPIASPGLTAITAMFEAEESEYYFFIHDTTGGVHYARTLAEHEANIARYLR